MQTLTSSYLLITPYFRAFVGSFCICKLHLQCQVTGTIKVCSPYGVFGRTFSLVNFRVSLVVYHKNLTPALQLSYTICCSLDDPTVRHFCNLNFASTSNSCISTVSLNRPFVGSTSHIIITQVIHPIHSASSIWMVVWVGAEFNCSTHIAFVALLRCQGYVPEAKGM